MPYTRNLIAYVSTLLADGAAAGNYPVMRTNTGNPGFIPLVAAVRVTEAANVATPATINVGYNPPNFNNIISGRQISALPGVTQIPLDAGANAVPEDTLIVVRVTLAAVPVPLTTATLDFRFILLGYDVEF